MRGRGALIKMLVAVVFLLVGFHLLGVFLGKWSWQLERLFDLGRESNVPNWFSSILFFSAAFVSYQLTHLASSKNEQRAWTALAFFLAFLSCDEICELHEKFSEIIQRMIHSAWFDANFSETSWPILFGPLILGAVLWFVLSLKKSFAHSPVARQKILCGIAIFFLGAAGVELLTNLMTNETAFWIKQMRLIFEESLEFVGLILFLDGLLKHKEFVCEGAVLNSLVEETL